MSTPARRLDLPPGEDGPLRVRPGRPAPAAPEAEPRPPLTVVPRRVRRRRAGVAITIGVAVVFALMLGLVAFQAKIAADQLRLDRMEHDLSDAQADYARLRLQVAQLEAPERVVEEAQHLGLVRPAPDQVTYLAPPAAVVARVLMAGGPQDGGGPTGHGDVQDWTELKPLLQGQP